MASNLPLDNLNNNNSLDSDSAHQVSVFPSKVSNNPNSNKGLDNLLSNHNKDSEDNNLHSNQVNHNKDSEDNQLSNLHSHKDSDNQLSNHNRDLANLLSNHNNNSPLSNHSNNSLPSSHNSLSNKGLDNLPSSYSKVVSDNQLSNHNKVSVFHNKELLLPNNLTSNLNKSSDSQHSNLRDITMVTIITILLMDKTTQTETLNTSLSFLTWWSVRRKSEEIITMDHSSSISSSNLISRMSSTLLKLILSPCITQITS